MDDIITTNLANIIITSQDPDRLATRYRWHWTRSNNPAHVGTKYEYIIVSRPHIGTTGYSCHASCEPTHTLHIIDGAYRPHERILEPHRSW